MHRFPALRIADNIIVVWGGAVTGGILGLLLCSKKMRKMAGGVFGYGGAAAAGAMAFKAYQNWQQGKVAIT
jgi:uncharacterized membrane protein YebE (DUF533 family)